MRPISAPRAFRLGLSPSRRCTSRLPPSGWGWRPALLERSSPVSVRSTSSIQSGHIKLDENEGILYISSELQCIGTYAGFFYSPIIRHLPPSPAMAAANSSQSFIAPRGDPETDQQTRPRGFGSHSHCRTCLAKELGSGNQGSGSAIQRGRRICQVCPEA